ncbi:MAG: hypothetical protein VYE22_40555 [Myxococcota bacterium]|nr:hypothetical protein [Myxococcota bacterium]
MALKRLSVQEMVKFSGDLLSETSPQRAALETHPEAAILVARLQAAHEGLVAAQPPNDSEIAELTEEITQLDLRHDGLVRALEGRLTSEITLAEVADDGRDTHDALRRARAVLFPDGLRVVRRSYVEQAGEAELREARMDEPVESLLRGMPIHDGRELRDVYGELQEVATQLGALVKRRAELGEEGEKVARTHQARYEWIRVVNALSHVLQMLGVDEGPILGRIREAERAAERRGAKPVDPAAPNDPAPDDPPVA